MSIQYGEWIPSDDLFASYLGLLKEEWLLLRDHRLARVTVITPGGCEEYYQRLPGGGPSYRGKVDA